MCIFTIIQTKDGFIAGSNRDDQFNRATDNKVTFDKDKQIYYVRDKVNCGTWLCVHTTGIVIVLLNKAPYIHSPHNKNLSSRGNLILDLAACILDHKRVNEFMCTKSMSCYNSFQLAICYPTIDQRITSILYDRDATKNILGKSIKNGSYCLSASTLYTQNKNNEYSSKISDITTQHDLEDFLYKNRYNHHDVETVYKKGVHTKSQSIITYNYSDKKAGYQFTPL